MSAVLNESPLLVNAAIGDALPFCRAIEAFGTVSPTISITFSADGVNIVTVVEGKKKKTNPIHFEAIFHKWNFHSYNYSADKEICLKFDKTTIVERIKPIKQHEILGMKIRKNVQALYTLINDKGDDKLPALIESTVEANSTVTLPIAVQRTDEPLGWNSRKDYVDLCTAIKRASPCEVKMEVYATGVVFLLIRYATKDPLPYKAGSPSGEVKATYNIDPSVFTLINTKVSKIVEELATIKFYVLPRSKDSNSIIFVTEWPAGVSGVIRIYYTADLINTSNL